RHSTPATPATWRATWPWMDRSPGCSRSLVCRWTSWPRPPAGMVEPNPRPMAPPDRSRMTSSSRPPTAAGTTGRARRSVPIRLPRVGSSNSDQEAREHQLPRLVSSAADEVTDGEPHGEPQGELGAILHVHPRNRWQWLLALCSEIDGFPRHLGIHVGGMLVTR